VEFDGIKVESSARVSHDLATRNRGTILPSNRGTMIGRHGQEKRTGGPTGTCEPSPRNCVMEPDEYVFGRTGDIGINDPYNNGWDDRRDYRDE
jgi:hypothetical protein